MDEQQAQAAAPQQEQGGGGDQQKQVAALFQNVGQGLMMIGQYVQQVAPGGEKLVQNIMAQYEQLVGMVSEARQGGGQASPDGQPAPMETGGQRAQQAY